MLEDGRERRGVGIARPDGDLDGRRGFARFAARDGEGAGLVGPRSARVTRPAPSAALRQALFALRMA